MFDEDDDDDDFEENAVAYGVNQIQKSVVIQSSEKFSEKNLNQSIVNQENSVNSKTSDTASPVVSKQLTEQQYQEDMEAKFEDFDQPLRESKPDQEPIEV